MRTLKRKEIHGRVKNVREVQVGRYNRNTLATVSEKVEQYRSTLGSV